MREQVAVKLIALALWCFIGIEMAIAFQNEPDGYGGIRWGATIPSLEDMRSVRDSGEDQHVKIYVKKDESLKMEEAILESVEYEFFRGKLGRVTLRVRDISNFVLLREAAFRKFGVGKELLPNLERYYWDGEKTRIELVSRFDFS